MGMPLYLQQPPTGYKDTAEAWVSTSGLLARLNFALDLAAGRVRGVRVAARRWRRAAERSDAPRRGWCRPALRATQRTLDGERPRPARVAGLILGSPEFQRR